MTEVVINGCYGGFGLSREAELRYLDLKGIEYEVKQTYDGKGQPYKSSFPKGDTHIEIDGHELSFYDRNIDRDDPALVQTVKELGPKANGFCAGLEIIEVPDYAKWHIEEYDGLEHVAEDHETWG